jgi:endoglycosylceramidase
MRAWTFLLAIAVACKSEGSSPPPEGEPCIGPDFDGSPLGITCGHLVDAQGRTALLHGMNARIEGIFDVTFQDGRLPLETIPPWTAEDAQKLRSFGFNALRLPINWSGIEPTETGGFDEAYLARVEAVVRTCQQNGIYVLLDIHQDAYSKEIGEDGAPLWAIVPPPEKLLGGPMNDLGERRASRQVTAAFATFFGANGKSLRERFGKMAAHVARRFADDPAVIGLELFNEPIASDAEVLAFHKEILPAVRAAAPRKLVLFEPNAVRNILDRVSPGTGSIGPGTEYAPHVYTFVFTGTDESRAAITKDKLRPSNESARTEADGLEAPLVITEWGYDPKQPNYQAYVQWQQELQDEHKASAFYWVWKELEQGQWGLFDGTAERTRTIEQLSRVRLEAAPGRLLSVRYENRRFEAKFTGQGSVRVSIGRTPGDFKITCDGRPVEVPRAEPLEIPCAGHTVVLE